MRNLIMVVYFILKGGFLWKNAAIFFIFIPLNTQHSGFPPFGEVISY